MINDLLERNTIELIVIGVFSITGLVFIVNAILGVLKSKNARNWITADGEITKSEITSSTDAENHTETFNATIEYRYSISGKEYQSSRVYYGSGISMTGKKAKSLLLTRKYPLLKKVVVYYNPDKENESVLEPEVHNELYWSLGIGVLLIIISLFLFVR